MLSVTPCVLLISHACVSVLLLHTTVQAIACRDEEVLITTAVPLPCNICGSCVAGVSTGY